MGEVPLKHRAHDAPGTVKTPTHGLGSEYHLQGYLAHKKTPPPLELPWGPKHRPTVGS